MDRLKVSTRLYLLIALFSVLLVGIGALGIWGMRASNASLQTVHADRAVPLGQLAEVQRNLLEAKGLALQAIADGQPHELVRLRTEVDERRAATNKIWQAYMATYLTADEAVLAKRVATLREQFESDGVLATMAAAQGGQVDLANKIFAESLQPTAAKLFRELDQLLHLQIDVARGEAERASASYDAMLTVAITAIGLGLAGGVFIGGAIVRSLTRALGAEPAEAAAMVRAVASGDLTVRVPVRAGDATSLSASLAAMIDSLRHTVGSVRRDADSVAVASAEIAQGNLDLSQRTEEQASALQQTAASMEQLNETVRRNADTARQARDNAMRATETATRGGQVVSQVVETMRDIENSSRRISEIIGTIDGIAFQTNILALNAAVEAARAGEQGRGFAVVAGEVRLLAQRSAEASREIRTLIASSVERVEKGGALVDEAGATMQDVVTAIGHVSQLAGEISTASDEQAAGVAQIGQAVSQMDSVTQQNAALVEQGTAAAESLRQQSQQLLDAVSVFRTDGNAAAQVPVAQPAPMSRPAPAATPATAPASGWDGVERRGPNRAQNVVRPSFARRATPQSAASAPAETGARNGTDGEWTTF
jgi:methyl-accepting chemotaxis protein